MNDEAKKILTVFGTRPEAIKMAPVVKALAADSVLDAKICVTAQHRTMLDQVLDIFGIRPDFDLNLMKPGQDLSEVTAHVLLGMRDVYRQWRPDMVLVHGDTSTAFAASLSAFYAKIPVGHVEAGLRTHNKNAPWPEEMNRCLTAVMADMHFTPTEQSRAHLLREGIAANTIHVTGNTVIDALLDVVRRIRSDCTMQQRLDEQFGLIDPARRLILVTGHRRENFGTGFENICHAMKRLAQRPDVQILYPVHLNPHVQEPVQRLLADTPNIHLLEPQDYVPFVYLMDKAALLITDSGGIQEEAPSLGKPVLVMRESTERPEAVTAGTVKLVGARTNAIVAAASHLLDNTAAYASMAQAHNPYGDGQAAQKIVRILRTGQ